MKKFLYSFIKLAVVFFVVCAASHSYAQIPQPTPTNPYPWTQQPTYSPQYYDWQPLRYFGPKYAGYLNTEEPLVYVARSLTIGPLNLKKPMTVIAWKLGLAAGTYKTGVNLDTKNAVIAGSVKRNDAQTVDLRLSVFRDDAVIWNTQILNYNLAKGTITDKAADMLPFVFANVPAVQMTDVFEIRDVSTGQTLFGPMSFDTLGEIEKLEQPFEYSWYYKITDSPLEKSLSYKTKQECLTGLAANNTRSSTDPECYQDGGFVQSYDIWWFYYVSLNPEKASDKMYPSEKECKVAGKEDLKKDVICYTKHLKTIKVTMVTDNNFVVGNAVDDYSKITNTTAHLLFRVDTHGATANLGVYYQDANKKYDADKKVIEPTLVKIVNGVHNEFAKSTQIIADIANLTKDTKYTIYVIDQDDLLPGADGKVKKVSDVKKLFEGTILTKETNSFIKNTLPTISDKLLPNFELGDILDGPENTNPLRLVNCGYDGAPITTVVDGKLVEELGKIGPDTDNPADATTSLLKPDPYFDKPDPTTGKPDGKITGDGRSIDSEWMEKNGKSGFQPHGETCDFDDIIDLIRRAQKYLLVMVPLIAAGMFAWAGALFLTSAGNATKVKQAKDIMKYTLLGIVVVLLAWLIVANIYVLLGIDKSWSWLKL